MIFSSDNYSPVPQQVLDALIEANKGYQPSYGGDSQMIKVGDASGNRTQATGHWHMGGSNSGDIYDVVQHSGTFLDSPATTSSVTYKIMIGTPHASSYNVHVNRSGNDANFGWEGRTA